MLRTHASAAMVTGSTLLPVLLAAAVTTLVAVRQRRSRAPAVSVPGPPGPEPEPFRLPIPIGDFAGRLAEIDGLLRLVHEGRRAIAVTGAPGLGKSTLAIRFAHELRPLFPDGQVYADLGAGCGEPAAPAAVLARLLGALGAPAEERTGDPAALAARLRSRTAGRRVLLLLDDAADAAQVRPLLPGGEHCLALITSRDALTGLPEAIPVRLGALAEPDAAALLASVAGGEPAAAPQGNGASPGRSRGGGGRIPAPGPHRADALVRACGAVPLALRIAAAAGGRPHEAAVRIVTERARLDALHIGDVAVRAAFDTGFDALATADRHLLRSLGAHPGARFTARIAAAAAAWDLPAAHTGLERLTGAQLVLPAGPDGYRLHDLVRRFAAERLERDTAPGDRRAALERILDAYTDDASDPGARPWGCAEQSTVSLLVRAGVREGLHRPAHRLAVAADRRLLDHPGQLPRIAMWAAVLDAARRSGEQGWTADALRGLGAAYAHEGRLDQAVDHLRMALAVQRRAATRAERAEQIRTRRLLGSALRSAGRYEEALRELRTALDGCREAGDTTGEAEVLCGLGALHLDRRRPDEAIDCLERALPLLAQRGDDPGYVADARRHLGSAYVQAGSLVPAERHLHSALAVHRTRPRNDRDAVGEGWTLRELGFLEEHRGAYGAGAELHHAALAAFERAGHAMGVAAAAEAIGDNLLAQGEQVVADTWYRRAAAVHTALGDHVRAAETRRKLTA
ncbi:tetratricopeptide repeat protein [Streptomyces sp. NPDC055709]